MSRIHHSCVLVFSSTRSSRCRHTPNKTRIKGIEKAVVCTCTTSYDVRHAMPLHSYQIFQLYAKICQLQASCTNTFYHFLHDIPIFIYFIALPRRFCGNFSTHLSSLLDGFTFATSMVATVTDIAHNRRHRLPPLSA